MILIMICMLLFVIGKMMIILLMILKIFLVLTLRVMIWKALSLGMIGLQVLYPLVMWFDNSFSSKNKDNMFTHIVSSNDNALIYYDDVITPIFSDYKGTYDIRRNYPYETCHDHGVNYSLVEHHLPNTQLIYSVQVVYDSPTPTITNEKDYAYVESKSTLLHVDH